MASSPFLSQDHIKLIYVTQKTISHCLQLKRCVIFSRRLICLEFLARCSAIYKDLELTNQNSHDPVVVPTSEESTPRVHDDETTRPDGVDSMTLMRALLPLVEQLDML